MPKAIQFLYDGHPLAGGAIFMTDGDHIGAFWTDPELAEEDERLNIAGNRENFALAYDLPAEKFEVRVLEYNGSESYCSEHGLTFVPLPNEQTADAIPVSPRYLAQLEEQQQQIAAQQAEARNAALAQLFTPDEIASLKQVIAQ